MNEQQIRELEQAKAILDYFLETDLSKLGVTPSVSAYTIPESSTSKNDVRSYVPPPHYIPLNLPLQNTSPFLQRVVIISLSMRQAMLRI